jgi:hypothetical protein
MTSGIAQTRSTMFVACSERARHEIICIDSLLDFLQMPQHVDISADHREECDFRQLCARVTTGRWPVIPSLCCEVGKSRTAIKKKSHAVPGLQRDSRAILWLSYKHPKPGTVVHQLT